MVAKNLIEPLKTKHSTLPTMYDLPSEDPEEPGLPDDFHYFQPQLLRETFCPPHYATDDVYIATDLNLYYDVHHPLRYKRPDWFAVLGASRLYQRKELRLSYVIWDERVVPFIVVELLSPGTEKEDLGETLRDAIQPPVKWEVYEQILQIPYYAVFDRYAETFHVFKLIEGRYRDVLPKDNWVWLPEAELGLGLWFGEYEGIQRNWMRWSDSKRNWVLTPVEKERQRTEQAYLQVMQERQKTEQAHLQVMQERQKAEQAHLQVVQERQKAEQAHLQVVQERQKAEQAHLQVVQERQKAESEKQRAERLAAQLRALGIEPD